MDGVAGKQPVPDQEEGWLPDPEQEGQERFWDGEAWTDEVRPDGRRTRGWPTCPSTCPSSSAPWRRPRLTSTPSRIGSRPSSTAPRVPRARGPAPPGAGPPPVPAEALQHHDDDGADDDDAAADVGDDDLLLEDFDEEPEVFEDEDDELDAGVDDDEDEEDEFADLDAALASESPEDSDAWRRRRPHRRDAATRGTDRRRR